VESRQSLSLFFFFLLLLRGMDSRLFGGCTFEHDEFPRSTH
jgi:hypothetical protein